MSERDPDDMEDLGEEQEDNDLDEDLDGLNEDDDDSDDEDRVFPSHQSDENDTDFNEE